MAKISHYVNHNCNQIFFQLVIAEDDLESLGEQYKEALQELRNVIEKEDTEELQRSISSKRVKFLKKRKISSMSNGHK